MDGVGRLVMWRSLRRGCCRIILSRVMWRVFIDRLMDGGLGGER